MEYYLYYALRNVTLIAPAVVDPNFELRGKGLLALPAFLPSVIVFFTQNNGGRPSWAPPLDPPLSGSFKGWITSMVASFVSYIFCCPFGRCVYSGAVWYRDHLNQVVPLVVITEDQKVHDLNMYFQIVF